MFNHAPSEYACPFCLIARGQDSAVTTQQDVVYRTEHVTAFIPSHFWENNEGHVIVIPNEHFENIFDLPDELGAKIHGAARHVALALKECYRCDGVSTRQHNEPSGDQEVWHYHLHVFPRYPGDNLYLSVRRPSSPEERLRYAEKLRSYFSARINDQAHAVPPTARPVRSAF